MTAIAKIKDWPASKRLLRLADELDSEVVKNAKAKFRMNCWAMSDGGFQAGDVLDIHVCGSAACACGFAAGIPEFRRAGLKLVHIKYGRFELRYRRTRDFQAARALFKLTYTEAVLLFAPSRYRASQPRLKTVSARIRKKAEQLKKEGR